MKQVVKQAESSVRPAVRTARANLPSGLLLLLCTLVASSELRAQASLCGPRELEGAAPGERLGAAIAALGDVNGDGRTDFAVGVPLAFVPGVGPAGVVRAISGEDFTILWEVPGEEFFSQFGSALTAIADRDGDGIDELVVGSWGREGQRGNVYLLSGQDGSRLWRRSGAADERMGWALDRAGDVDGDGTEDILVGGPGYLSGRGRARILSGADSSPLFIWDGAEAGEGFGFCVARGGTLTPDLVDDFVIGAPDATVAGQASTGRIELRDGATGGVARVVEGVRSGQRFGVSVVAIDDRDRDGRSELFVGAPEDDMAGAGSGAVFVISGLSGQILDERLGQQAGESYGHAVGLAGRRDSTGMVDLAVSAPGHDEGTGPDTGRVELLRQTDLGLRVTLFGSVSGERFGESLGPPARIDGNDRADLIIGAPSRTTGVGSGAGWCGVFHAPFWQISGVPAIGNQLVLRAQNAPQFEVPFGLLVTDGFVGQQAWLGFSPSLEEMTLDQGGGFLTRLIIPIDPRRYLLVGPEMMNALGEATVNVLLPAVPFLDGCQLYGQAISVDPTGRLLASSRLDVTFGR